MASAISLVCATIVAALPFGSIAGGCAPAGTTAVFVVSPI
jgi:uncharacterized membrane protein YtjA (UPF0391 family)